MTTFTPRTYKTLEEAAKVSIMDAHSDSHTEEGMDVFGYLEDGTIITCEYVWDEISEQSYAVAAIKFVARVQHDGCMSEDMDITEMKDKSQEEIKSWLGDTCHLYHTYWDIKD